MTGYQILLDLLYENEKYEDLLHIYRELNAKGRLYKNKYIDVIVLATYYRLVSVVEFSNKMDFHYAFYLRLRTKPKKNDSQNTPDAFEQAYELWTQLTEVGNKVQFRKSRTFTAGLALKQNRPELALKILEGETIYVTMRHIKLLAWAQIGKFDEVFKMLEELIKLHGENPKLKPFSSISVVSVLR